MIKKLAVALSVSTLCHGIYPVYAGVQDDLERRQIVQKKALQKQQLRRHLRQKQAQKQQSLLDDSKRRQSILKKALQKQELRKQLGQKRTRKQQSLLDELKKRQAMLKKALQKQELRKQLGQKQAEKPQLLVDESKRRQEILKKALQKKALRKPLLQRRPQEQVRKNEGEIPQNAYQIARAKRAHIHSLRHQKGALLIPYAISEENTRLVLKNLHEIPQEGKFENPVNKAIAKNEEGQVKEISQVVLNAPQDAWQDWDDVRMSEDEAMETSMLKEASDGTQSLASSENSVSLLEQKRGYENAVAKVAELLEKAKSKEIMESEMMDEAMELSLLEKSSTQNLSRSSTAKTDEEMVMSALEDIHVVQPNELGYLQAVVVRLLPMLKANPVLASLFGKNSQEKDDKSPTGR